MTQAQATWSFVVVFILAGNLATEAATFTIPDGDVTELINAINTANANSEADIINLATNGTYTLTEVNYTSSSPGTSGFESERGLPNIVDDVSGLDLIINGNGATIQRSTTAPAFGLFSCKGYTIFNNLTFRNAQVNAQGAALFLQFKGQVELNNCSFYDNESLIDIEGGGGAIYTKSLSQLSVSDCLFEGNKAVNNGAAISNLLTDMTISDCTFNSNELTSTDGMGPSAVIAGGAVYSDGARGDNGSLVVTGSTFDNNSCPGGQGGGLFLFPYNNNAVEVTDCTFTNNTAGTGAGYWHDGGTVEITDSEFPFTDVPATHTLDFHSNVFEDNIAETQGGGLWIRRGTIGEMYDCTFKNNTANNGSTGLGGGIFLRTEEDVTIKNCTFNENNARTAGGISFNHETSTATVINCTFDGNIADAFGGAASVAFSDPDKAVSFTNCTFANNEGNNPGNGSSASIHSGNNSTLNTSVTITNCIFYNQSVANTFGGIWRDCFAPLTDGGNNLFDVTRGLCGCITTADEPNNFFSTDPLLSSLADNGGPTQTMALQSGSPAIDQGASSGCPTTDQRGATRDANCDIGAYEADAILPVALTQFNTHLWKDEVTLSWQTASERNNAGFEIERSSAGKSWRKLGFITGHGTTDAAQTYTFLDQHPAIGFNYYRLKQIDFDGAFTYSPITSVDYQLALEDKQLYVYPNPFKEQLTINASNLELKHIKVINMLGQDMTNLIQLHQPSTTQVLLTTSLLQSGWYFIQTDTLLATKVFKIK